MTVLPGSGPAPAVPVHGGQLGHRAASPVTGRGAAPTPETAGTPRPP
ncbi:hypothetical protein [Streptomyces sp. NPDC127020]